MLRDYTLLLGIDRKTPYCSSSHNGKTVLNRATPLTKNSIASHKDSVNSNMQQGPIYQSPCLDCDFSYIGETKRCFFIRIKKYLTDIQHLRFDKSALTKHVFDYKHSMDWTNAKILDFKLDFTKCQNNQIKSFIILAVLRQSVQKVYGARLRVNCARITQFLLKKCCIGGEPWATLCPI